MVRCWRGRLLAIASISETLELLRVKDDADSTSVAMIRYVYVNNFFVIRVRWRATNTSARPCKVLFKDCK